MSFVAQVSVITWNNTGLLQCRRSTYKPHEITWAEVAEEASTGKLFRMATLDREGRPVLVMRPR